MEQKSKTSRIAAFIDSLQPAERLDPQPQVAIISTLLDTSGGRRSNRSTNRADCTNELADSCRKAHNGRDCRNAFMQCEDSFNGGNCRNGAPIEP